MLHFRKNSGVTRFVVASSATCFAPFSQNSKCERSRSGSGQAQPGQSTPPVWFTFRRVRTPRTSPISSEIVLTAVIIAGAPPAAFGIFVSTDYTDYTDFADFKIRVICVICVKKPDKEKT